jgi:hypothetical protein
MCINLFKITVVSEMPGFHRWRKKWRLREEGWVVCIHRAM